MHFVCGLWRSIFTILHFLMELNFLVFSALLSVAVMLSVSTAVLVVVCVSECVCVVKKSKMSSSSLQMIIISMFQALDYFSITSV